MNSPVNFSLEADGTGWIVFDQPGATANVFNPQTQAALAVCVGAARRSGARAVIVRSAKPRIFVAGADLKWLARLPDAAAAADFSRTGQALFQSIADLPMPVICAIHGACAGGGFELALACHWRIASDGAPTRIGLPEVELGTIPGWGGCVRLPRLIGASAALEHILRARLLAADEALRAGLVDEVVPEGELLARARAVALRLAAANALPLRNPPPAPAPGFFSQLRTATTARGREHLPAPLAAIDAIERGNGLDPARAAAIEAETFARVTVGDVCRNLVEVFHLKQAAKKRTLAGWFSAVANPPPAPVRRAGVIGAGVMGTGIAHCLAAHGYEVVLRDVRPDLLEQGLTVIRRLGDEAARHGRLTPETARAALARITTTTGWDGFAACDVVIEAIVEDPAAKQRLFLEVAAQVRPDTLLVSNTSALPIELIAGDVPHPERTLGLHFFNPVGRMPLVEMVLAPATAAEPAARALALVLALGKSPVIARSTPGFLVTRVLFFYLNAAVKLWQAGVPTAELDGALQDFGWPMGPLRLLDEVGLDVSEAIFQELTHFFPARFTPATACRALLAAGARGRKNGTGTGFYTYPDGRPVVNDAAELARPGQGVPPALSRSVITAQLMAVMIDEARRCLAEGVVLAPDDIDFALLAGAGFPAFRGGLMRYARTLEPHT